MSAYSLPPFKPTSSHITLFFKHHKTTIVLSLLPTDSITYAKQQLVSALRSRNITTFPGTSIPLPSDPSEIEFGILNDKKDSQSGWMRAEDRTTLPKKKDKRSKSEDGEVESVGEWDLRDGGYVAYRLRKTMDIELDEAVEVEEQGEWDVVVPAYEEEVDEMDEEEIEIPRPRNHAAGEGKSKALI